jgi:hypothetical protein
MVTGVRRTALADTRLVLARPRNGRCSRPGRIEGIDVTMDMYLNVWHVGVGHKGAASTCSSSPYFSARHRGAGSLVPHLIHNGGADAE